MKITLCLCVSVLKIFYLMTPVFSQQTASDSVFTEEILVTANRIKITAMLSPNKVQILNKEFIASISGSKLSDVLNYADAVFIKDYGFNSGLKTISLNSTQSEQTLILLDGVKLNSKQNSLLDAGLIKLDEINRIEISKGGSSSLYGSEAVGGVINIISVTDPKQKELNLDFKVSMGSYNFKRIFVRGSRQIKKFSYHLSYSRESSDNDYDYKFPGVAGLTQRKRTNSEYYSDAFKASGSFTLTESSSLCFFNYYNYWNRNIPGVELGYPSPSSKQIDRDLISSVRYKKNSKNRAEFSGGFDYKYSLMNYYSPSLPINSFYKLNTFNNNAEYRTPLSKIIFIDAGYEINYSSILSNEVEYGTRLQAGFYAGSKIELHNLRITFYPSVRYDRFSDINKNVLTGKFGVNIKPVSKIDLTFKSSLGNNFREPSFNDLYWLELGNKNLLPEKSVSFDAGLYYDFKLLSDNKIELAYFNINTTERIIWQPDAFGVWHPLNIGKVKSEGIDVSLHARLNVTESISVLGSANYNLASSLKTNKDSENDPAYLKQLIYLPQQYSKASFMLNYLPESTILKSVSLNAFYTFTGKRFVNPANSIFVPYFEIIDANISIVFNLFKIESYLKFAVNNLSNSNYEVISGYPMPLRNYKFEIGLNY